MPVPRITVIGSINMDLVTQTDTMPEQGETLAGTGFSTLPGGKGANQAVAAARLGGDVRMIGKVGSDPFGEALLENLKKQNVDATYVAVEEGSSGLANIIVTDNDNRIIIIPGANEKMDVAYIEQFREEIAASDYVLIQFEIPKATIEAIIDLCHALDVRLIINPAPAMELDEEHWEKATFITPNDNESEKLFGAGEGGIPKFHEKLIITQGAEGASYFSEGRMITVPTDRVDVVDTTGAGDTFNGALAVALAAGRDAEAAIAYANRAAGLSVQKLGAQGGMPTEAEMEAEEQ